MTSVLHNKSPEIVRPQIYCYCHNVVTRLMHNGSATYMDTEYSYSDIVVPSQNSVTAIYRISLRIFRFKYIRTLCPLKGIIPYNLEELCIH